MSKSLIGVALLVPNNPDLFQCVWKSVMTSSSSLTLMHVSPAANRTAVVVGKRHAFLWKTDGSDERGSPHAPPVLLLQFDQNWRTETENVM